MSLIQRSIEQPITVSVGILIALLAGVIAITRVPVQMTPEIDDTIIAVTTSWENASPQEIESEVIDKQEEKLQGLASLKSISSISEKGKGQIRLEFSTGTNKEDALREVSDKLREIPAYPDNVDEPVVEASDPETNDFIAWFLLKTEDDFDIQSLQDFTQDRVKPILERTPGLSEVNVLGGREREAQIIFDPNLLAQHKISISELTRVLRNSNKNISAGALQHGKYDLRVRTVGRFSSPDDITKLIIRQDQNGKVVLGDLAIVKETYKEQTGFVRNNGRTVLAINFQREPGSNVIEVMKALKASVEEINQPGNVLDSYAKAHHIKGLKLVQVYDQTDYIDQAFSLVQSSMLYGSVLATIILMIFLRSFSAVGIIAISIPISVIGAVVGMVILGRSVNVISLAGMSFAVGMVVDNAIVVLENIYRHAEMGKSKAKAAYDGAKEVGGAVLASTLTTLLVFIPILLVQESAGQLLRDISLAIVVSVGLSYIVAITVIPSGAAMFLKPKSKKEGKQKKGIFISFAGLLSSIVSWISEGTIKRIVFVLVFSVATFFGIIYSIPPIDYLPTGNRNLVFGVILPPPGLNVEEFDQMAQKVEDKIRPYWEANGKPDQIAKLPEVPSGFMPNSPKVRPPAVKHYFIVAFPGMLFHGGICADEKKVVDQVALFNNATSQFVLPGVFGFAFQAPLFRLGGNSGSAIKLDFTGTDLKKVTPSALAMMGTLMKNYGPMSTRPDPSNFYTPTPELQMKPNQDQLSRYGMTTSDLGEIMQAYSDGLFIGEYIKDGELIDLKLLSSKSVDSKDVSFLNDIQTATPTGQVVNLNSLGSLSWLSAPEKIKRVNRQRAVTLEFTPPAGVPLQGAIESLQKHVEELKQAGGIAPGVSVEIAGSASKLNEVKNALLGDGTIKGLVTSAMFLALLVVYLLMCVLFQSWIYPMVIMYSVPLATFGGFYGLSTLSAWSNRDRYMPVQNLDILTILGFIILAGVVVNNAILIVAQTLNLIKNDPTINPKEAISKAVENRVRPIFMSMLTSIGGMLPLVFNPGAGSELYRGLGAVVIGGLLVSTVFTLILVPVLLGIVFDLKGKINVKAIAQMGIVFLIIQGCSVGPNYKNPDVIIANKWQQQLPKETKVTKKIEAQWWKKFNDPALNKIMDLTLQNNFDIKMAQSRVVQARYLRGVTKADLWPSLDADAAYTKSLSSENLSNDFSNVNFKTKSQDKYAIGLGTAWELDLFGGVRRNIESEKAKLERSSILTNGVVLAMLSASAESYIEIRSLTYRKRLHKEMVAMYQKSVDLVRSKKEAGLATAFELSQAKAQLAQSVIGLPEIQKNLVVQKNRLKILTGSSPLKKDKEELPPMVKPFFLESIGLEAPAIFLRRRPDVLVAERQIAIESAKIGVAKADLYPRFFINGTFHLSASDIANVFKSGSEAYGFGPSIQWNIFSRNKIKNKARAQKEKMNEAELNFYKTVYTAIAEVENAIAGYHSEKNTYRRLVASLIENQNVLNSAQSRYKEGLVTLDVVLDAQKEVSKQKNDLAKSGAKVSKSIVYLYKALGGSWYTPVTSNKADVKKK
ncbi:MAG: hypothetical protein COA79_18550 [Planctomycetota bacterium]|nr:MAG: hypothetical protein COA79_18550 [Planctomycetota bacterium]